MLKKIPIDTRYSVTDKGQIISTTRKLPIALYQQLDPDGYPVVRFAGKTQRVHKIVAKLFIPNPENKPLITHKDGDKANNRVDNLMWTTTQESMDHRRDKNLLVKKHINQICRDTGKIVATHIGYKSVLALGFTQCSVCRCCKGKQKNPQRFQMGVRLKRTLRSIHNRYRLNLYLT